MMTDDLVEGALIFFEVLILYSGLIDPQPHHDNNTLLG
jgi:hypothetical protein